MNNETPQGDPTEDQLLDEILELCESMAADAKATAEKLARLTERIRDAVENGSN